MAPVEGHFPHEARVAFSLYALRVVLFSPFVSDAELFCTAYSEGQSVCDEEGDELSRGQFASAGQKVADEHRLRRIPQHIDQRCL
ncbi:hypothetical protein, partial [Deinococcus sp. UYEF24]